MDAAHHTPAGDAAVHVRQVEIDPDVAALARRLLDDLGVSPGALMVGRADVETAIARAIDFGGIIHGAAHGFGPACRVCGCTEFRACGPDGCCWVEADLCSRCAPFTCSET